MSRRVGGLGIIGPTTAHPASPFYNPATLSLLTGHHVYAEGMAVLGAGHQQANAVDPTTGAPRADGALLDERSSVDLVAPRFYASINSDLGLSSFNLGLSFSAPATVSYSALQGPAGGFFDPVIQGAGRYHATDFSLYHLYLAPAASVNVVDELAFGLAFIYVFGSLDYGFVRDAALQGGATLERDASGRPTTEYAALDDCGANARCDYGSDRAAEAIRIQGSGDGVALATGVLFRPHPSWTLGAGFVSGVLGGISARGTAWVRRAQATVDNAAAAGTAAGSRDAQGRGTVTYWLPNVLSAGVNWQTTPRLALDLQLRWTTHSAHKQLQIRLTGSEFRDEPQLPEGITHYQGLDDTFSAQLGAAYFVGEHVELSAAVMLESAAVPNAAVSPMMVDGWKVDSLVALRWNFHRYFSLRAGYGLVLMPDRQVNNSAFDPSLLVNCADGFYDVDKPVCQAAQSGLGLASAAGRYGLALHRFSLALSMDIW